MSATAEILALLTPLLPARWRLQPYLSSPADLDRTLVMIQPTDFARAAETPLVLRDVTVKLSVVNPSQDDEKAPGLLYDELLELSLALDQASLRWDTFSFAVDPDSGHWFWTTNLTFTINPKEA